MRLSRVTSTHVASDIYPVPHQGHVGAEAVGTRYVVHDQVRLGGGDVYGLPTDRLVAERCLDPFFRTGSEW